MHHPVGRDRKERSSLSATLASLRTRRRLLPPPPRRQPDPSCGCDDTFPSSCVSTQAAPLRGLGSRRPPRPLPGTLPGPGASTGRRNPHRGQTLLGHRFHEVADQPPIRPLTAKVQSECQRPVGAISNSLSSAQGIPSSIASPSQEAPIHGRWQRLVSLRMVGTVSQSQIAA
jgi:hypothetical protein